MIGTVIPTIFLAVAAFLLNVVLHRQVAIQRGEIAALKALGYGNGAIARHYLSQVAVICAIGTVVGLGVGFWFGEGVTGLYAQFFHFPSYRFEMPLGVALAALAVTLAAAVGGALSAVRRPRGWPRPRRCARRSPSSTGPRSSNARASSGS